MSGINDKSGAADRFEVISNKAKVNRSLLTPQERKVIALGKIAEQAKFELANAQRVAAAHAARIQDIEKRAAEAAAAYAKARTALEQEGK